MSYSKSYARTVYDDFSHQLLLLAKSANRIPNTTLSYNHKDLIYKSLIVLLCSAIEEYHKTFIEDWFFRLKLAGVKMNKIPINARMIGFLHNTENHYKNFLYNRENEKDIIDKLTGSKDILKKYVDDNELFDITWLPNCVWGNKKYPSVKNMAVLYNRLGIPNIFDALSMSRHKDYKGNLDSFLSVRESIAHTGAGTVTYDDVKRHICYVDDLIHSLDRVLHRHCCQLSGSVNWPKR